MSENFNHNGFERSTREQFNQTNLHNEARSFDNKAWHGTSPPPHSNNAEVNAMLGNCTISGNELPQRTHHSETSQPTRHRYNWTVESAANPLNGMLVGARNAAEIVQDPRQHHFHPQSTGQMNFGRHSGRTDHIPHSPLPSRPEHVYGQHQGYSQVAPGHYAAAQVGHADYSQYQPPRHSHVYGSHQGYNHVQAGYYSNRSRH